MNVYVVLNMQTYVYKNLFICEERGRRDSVGVEDGIFENEGGGRGIR